MAALEEKMALQDELGKEVQNSFGGLPAAAGAAPKTPAQPAAPATMGSRDLGTALEEVRKETFGQKVLSSQFSPVAIPVQGALAAYEGVKNAPRGMRSEVRMSDIAQLDRAYFAGGLSKEDYVAGLKNVGAQAYADAKGIGVQYQPSLGQQATIPMRREGTVTAGPELAIIGEGGEREYIIPESKMPEAMSRYAQGERGLSVIPNPAPPGALKFKRGGVVEGEEEPSPWGTVADAVGVAGRLAIAAPAPGGLFTEGVQRAGGALLRGVPEPSPEGYGFRHDVQRAVAGLRRGQEAVERGVARVGAELQETGKDVRGYFSGEDYVRAGVTPSQTVDVFGRPLAPERQPVAPMNKAERLLWNARGGGRQLQEALGVGPEPSGLSGVARGNYQTPEMLATRALPQAVRTGYTPQTALETRRLEEFKALGGDPAGLKTGEDVTKAWRESRNKLNEAGLSAVSARAALAKDPSMTLDKFIQEGKVKQAEEKYSKYSWYGKPPKSEVDERGRGIPGALSRRQQEWQAFETVKANPRLDASQVVKQDGSIDYGKASKMLREDAQKVAATKERQGIQYDQARIDTLRANLSKDPKALTPAQRNAMVKQAADAGTQLSLLRSQSGDDEFSTMGVAKEDAAKGRKWSDYMKAADTAVARWRAGDPNYSTERLLASMSGLHPATARAIELQMLQAYADGQ